MHYRIEKWVRNDIGLADLEKLQPFTVTFEESNTLTLFFSKRNANNDVLLRAELYVSHYEQANVKLSEYTDKLFSKVAFVSTTPMSLIINGETLVIKVLDKNSLYGKNREGLLQLPYRDMHRLLDSDDWVSEGFGGYLEFISEPHNDAKLDDYRIPLSYFRQSLVNPYPNALLYQYFALESLLEPEDVTPMCPNGHKYHCECGVAHSHHSKSTKRLRELMDEMGIEPKIQTALEKLRQLFSHGNIDMFKALMIVNNARKDVSDDIREKIREVEKKIEQSPTNAKLNYELFDLHKKASENLFHKAGMKFRDYLFKKMFPDIEPFLPYLTRSSNPVHFFIYDTSETKDEEISLEFLKSMEDANAMSDEVKILYTGAMSNF